MTYFLMLFSVFWITCYLVWFMNTVAAPTSKITDKLPDMIVVGICVTFLFHCLH